MAASKKILLVHRYYFPDTPAYAIILKKMAEKWALEGHDVSVLTSFPSYYGSSTENVKSKEELNGVSIKRIKLLPEKNRNLVARSLNTLLFAFLVFTTILFRKKYDVVTVATTPPIIMATMIRWASYIKRHHYIYHCQDIYPEIAYHNNNIKSTFLYRILRFIDKKNNNRASKIVVLSEDMKQTLVNERQINPSKISIINNFIRDLESKPVDYQFDYQNIAENDFRVVFCGNIGKLQNLDTIISIAHELKSYPSIKFIFIGSGIEVNKLKEQAGELLNNTVHFLGYFNSDVAVSALKKSSIGIVSISEPTYKTAYPSKTMTYLKVGLPVLAIVNKDSEIANFIEKNQLGIIANPSDKTSIKNTIVNLFSSQNKFNPSEIEKIAYQEFGEEVILEKWVQLINEL